MKKLLLSFVSAVMIGVTCFAPLSVSANENELVNNSVGYVNDTSFNLVENTGIQMGASGLFTYLASYNGASADIQVGIPSALVNADYYDIYITLVVDNIDLSNATYNKQFHLKYGNVSCTSFANAEAIFDKNEIRLTVKHQKYNKSSFDAFGFNFAITDIPQLDTSKSGNVYIKNVEVWHADTIEKLEKLQEDPMKDFLGSIGNVVADCIEWVVTVCNTIMEAPLLLLTTGMLCLGACIGLFGRFINKD